jgi:hypothetical protein
MQLKNKFGEKDDVINHNKLDVVLEESSNV